MLQVAFRYLQHNHRRLSPLTPYILYCHQSDLWVHWRDNLISRKVASLMNLCGFVWNCVDLVIRNDVMWLKVKISPAKQVSMYKKYIEDMHERLALKNHYSKLNLVLGVFYFYITMTSNKDINFLGGWWGRTKNKYVVIFKQKYVGKVLFSCIILVQVSYFGNHKGDCNKVTSKKHWPISRNIFPLPPRYLASNAQYINIMISLSIAIIQKLFFWFGVILWSE